MPDSSYAFPAKRKEPLNDASHVRNAIARFNQVEDVTDEERREAFARIKRAAERFDVEMSATSWRELADSGPSAKKSTSAGRRGSAGRSKEDLYAEAKRKNVKGRSSMTKEQLQRALDG